MNFPPEDLTVLDARLILLKCCIFFALRAISFMIPIMCFPASSGGFFPWAKIIALPTLWTWAFATVGFATVCRLSQIYLSKRPRLLILLTRGFDLTWGGQYVIFCLESRMAHKIDQFRGHTKFSKHERVSFPSHRLASPMRWIRSNVFVLSRPANHRRIRLRNWSTFSLLWGRNSSQHFAMQNWNEHAIAKKM